MNNTKNQPNKQDQKSQQRQTSNGHGPKKQGQKPRMLQSEMKHFEEQEHPETRLTR